MHSDPPRSGDAGAGSRRRPPGRPAAPAGPPVRWQLPPQTRRRRMAGRPQHSGSQHSFLTARLRLPSPPGMACRLHNQLLKQPPRLPTPPPQGHSNRDPSSQPVLPSSTQLLTRPFLPRSDFVELFRPLLVSHGQICSLAYCVCLLDAATKNQTMPKITLY